MRRRSNGQSLVEMALMLPLLLLILFGIIDLGYYVFGYSTVYQAARNGTEKGAELPPQINKLKTPSDTCVNAILEAIREDAVLFPDITDGFPNSVQISYPNNNKRAIGEPIQVEIIYKIEPLTPLFRFVSFGNQGEMTVHIQARRSIENLGENPGTLNGLACQ